MERHDGRNPSDPLDRVATESDETLRKLIAWCENKERRNPHLREEWARLRALVEDELAARKRVARSDLATGGTIYGPAL